MITRCFNILLIKILVTKHVDIDKNGAVVIKSLSFLCFLPGFVYIFYTGLYFLDYMSLLREFHLHVDPLITKNFQSLLLKVILYQLINVMHNCYYSHTKHAKVNMGVFLTLRLTESKYIYKKIQRIPVNLS